MPQKVFNAHGEEFVLKVAGEDDGRPPSQIDHPDTAGQTQNLSAVLERIHQQTLAHRSGEHTLTDYEKRELLRELAAAGADPHAVKLVELAFEPAAPGASFVTKSAPDREMQEIGKQIQQLLERIGGKTAGASLKFQPSGVGKSNDVADTELRKVLANGKRY